MLNCKIYDNSARESSKLHALSYNYYPCIQYMWYTTLDLWVSMVRTSSTLPIYPIGQWPFFVETLVFIVIGLSCSEGCAFDYHYRSCQPSSFNFRTIMSSPYCVLWNKKVQRLSVLKLSPTVERSVLSVNDGISLRQTVAHIHITVGTCARYAVWFMPFKEKFTIICSVSKPSGDNSGAGPYVTTTMGPDEEYIILVPWLECFCVVKQWIKISKNILSYWKCLDGCLDSSLPFLQCAHICLTMVCSIRAGRARLLTRLSIFCIRFRQVQYQILG